MKKLILFCFSAMCIYSVSAQIRGGGFPNRNNSYPNTNTTRANMPKFEPEKLAGLIEYDTYKVLKKISVKKNSTVGKKVIALFTRYNKDIRDLTRINTFTFKELKASHKAAQKVALDSKDFSIMREVQKNTATLLLPIRKNATTKDSLLNVQLKPLLSPKQLGKWEKFQKKEKERLIPRAVRQPRQTLNPNRRRGF